MMSLLVFILQLMLVLFGPPPSGFRFKFLKIVWQFNNASVTLLNPRRMLRNIKNFFVQLPTESFTRLVSFLLNLTQAHAGLFWDHRRCFPPGSQMNCVRLLWKRISSKLWGPLNQFVFIFTGVLKQSSVDLNGSTGTGGPNSSNEGHKELQKYFR